jgi:hypothetical protein
VPQRLGHHLGSAVLFPVLEVAVVHRTIIAARCDAHASGVGADRRWRVSLGPCRYVTGTADARLAGHGCTERS